MKINDYKVGTSFEIKCTKEHNVNNDEFYYDHFGICERLSHIWGRKPEQIINVKATIIEEDVLLENKYHDKNYDENCIDYFAIITWEDDGSLRIGCIYPNIKLYNMCFPYVIDECLFFDKDITSFDYETYELKTIHKKGDRHRMTVRLKVEEI